MTSIRVPFNSLDRAHHDIEELLVERFIKHIRDSDYINGRSVDEFSLAFADLIGSQFCIPCANGTDALWISLKALGIGEGDEVIVPSYTWVSTAEAVVICGARPVLCDVDSNNYTMCPESLERNITKNTKCIIPVHLAGNSCDLAKIMKIANRYSIPVVEDCAQSHLTYYQGSHVGLHGKLGTFSFYPGKNLGALGDAGCIVTQDCELAEWLRAFCNHGFKPNHTIIGTNSRMDSLQASFLSVKLPLLRSWTDRRSEVASIYLSRLKGYDFIKLPQVQEHATHSWHQFMIQTDMRDKLIEHMTAYGIQTNINYPNSLSKLAAYSDFDRLGCPNSDAITSSIMSLPLFPQIKRQEIEFVCDTVSKFSPG